MKFIVLYLLAPCVLANPSNLNAFKAHVGFLSSDHLKGRASGSVEIQQAAHYIALQFSSLGLKPLNASGYEQIFEVDESNKVDRNVVAWLPATNNTQESLIFIAHYDGLGVDESLQGDDKILNGARDNATGVAGLIELARRFSIDKERPINIVFIASAAEEIGALGAQFYLENPLFPQDEIQFVLNLDGVNVAGPRSDYFIMPEKGISYLSEFQDLIADEGWQYRAPEWVDYMDAKFDSAVFLRAGIPSLTLWAGERLPSGEKAEQKDLGQIHGPDDEIGPNWDWSGVMDHIDIYESLARYILSSNSRYIVTTPERFNE